MDFILSERNSIANTFIQELRDSRIQQDRMRFRKNMERLGEVMAYEVSQALEYETREVVTPIGRAFIKVIKAQPVLLTILRAGIPFFQGFLNFFDQADSGFIGAHRVESSDEPAIKLDYLATTSLDNKVVILIDPMLATGRSIMSTVNTFLKNGKPRHIHVVSLVAAPEGVEHLKQNLTLPYSLWTCALDEKLDPRFYIVPGLGDAGDLCYGVKL